VTEPLLTISAFARAVDLAPSTLRYYDEAGLLPPAEVDPQTGYRYYTPALERRAHMIRRMREVGVPVETMRTVLEGPPDRAVELLHAFAEEAAESARRTASAVSDVVSSLRAEHAPAGPVVAPVPGPELAAALSRVSGAAAPDGDAGLGVVLLDLSGSELTVVATNRYWMALWWLPLRGAHVPERRVAVPIDRLPQLVDWLARQDQVTLTVTDDATRLTGEAEEEVAVPTVEDRFPAYRLIFDDLTPASGRATVDREALARAVARETGTVRLVVGRDRVTVTTDAGPEGTRLDAVTSGEPIELRFSASLLGSALDAMVGSRVTLAYDTPSRAVRITSPEHPNLTALVMPFRVDG
jgi:DNA polymerase-3 subunit beta